MIVGAIIIVIGGILLIASGQPSNKALAAPGIMVLSLGSLTLAVTSLISPKKK